MVTTNSQERVEAVFVNGVWKSGNNLLLKLVNEVGYPTAPFGLATHLNYGFGGRARRLWISDFMGKGVPIGLEAPFNVGNRWLDRRLTKARGFALGGHAVYSARLVSILLDKGFAPVMVVRDPRDVVVSWARWICGRKDIYSYGSYAHLSERERMVRILDGVLDRGFESDDLGCVLDRAQGWLLDPRVTVVRYEDLVGEKGGGRRADQLSAINKILGRLGVKDVDYRSSVLADRLYGGTQTFRTGKIGSWKCVFDSGLVELFERKVGAARMEMYGYNI